MLLLQKLPDKKSEIINKFIAINEEINEILEKIMLKKSIFQMINADRKELSWKMLSLSGGSDLRNTSISLPSSRCVEHENSTNRQVLWA